MMVIQFAPGRGEETVVAGAAGREVLGLASLRPGCESSTTNDRGIGKLQFPMPTWQQRECERRYLRATPPNTDPCTISDLHVIENQCSGHGACSMEGLCVCDSGFTGDGCDEIIPVVDHGVIIQAAIIASIVLVFCMIIVCLLRSRHRQRRKRRREQSKLALANKWFARYVSKNANSPSTTSPSAASQDKDTIVEARSSLSPIARPSSHPLPANTSPRAHSYARAAPHYGPYASLRSGHASG